MTNPEIAWRKSSYSENGVCVQLADLGDGVVGLRDSKRPDGPILELPRAEFRALVDGLKAGEFDDIVDG